MDENKNPVEGTSTRRTRWQKAIRPTVIVIAVVLLVALNLYIRRPDVDPYILGVLCLTGINMILAAGLNLINGFTGQFSIGHAGFMAVGAYTAALLTTYRNFPFLPATVLGALAAGMMGLVVGIPALRLRGDYLAIVTLGFGEIIRVVINNIPITGGAQGLVAIPGYTTFYWVEGWLILILVLISNLIRSGVGRCLLAIREDEVAATALGVDTTFYKVLAFTIGAASAGVAGSLYAHQIMYIDPSVFGFFKSIEILIAVVLGGLGSLTGSVLAAGFLTALPELLRGFAEYRMIVYSALLVLVMLIRPAGLLGQLEAVDILGWRRRPRPQWRTTGTGSGSDAFAAVQADLTTTDRLGGASK